MPQPKVNRQMADLTIQAVEDALREGFVPLGMGGGRSAVQEAGDRGAAAGWLGSGSSIHSRLRGIKAAYGIEPDWTLYRPRQYQHRVPGLPIIPDQGHLTEDEPEGDPIRVCVIGDAHDSPHLKDKSRFLWIGRYIAEHGIERVISVGDWLTMDCFSSHVDRASFEGMAKPTFEQDLDSFHASQRAFQQGLAGHKPKLDITWGNHEARVLRYDNQHPDGLSHRVLLEEAFAQWGWRVTPYGEYRFIGGVGFTHVPFNALGRPLTQAQRPNKAMFDTIHGDDHRATQITDFKSGPVRSPTVYSAGTALPPGFIEGFANKGGSTWRSGICEAVLWGGHVRSWKFEEMILLRRKYGDALAA